MTKDASPTGPAQPTQHVPPTLSRTRTMSVSRPLPNNAPYRIASSYNLRDPPVFDPVANSEPIEVVDAEKGEKRPIDASSTGADRSSGTYRRRSTVASFKPPEIVTWEGSGDPENPRNWRKSKKWGSTVIVSLFVFMAPLASSMIAPALDQMGEDLQVTSPVEKEIMLSIFILAFAVGPIIFGPLSEVFGRKPMLQATNMIYLAFNIACALAKTKKQMMAFRFLSGLGGSGPAAIGGGVLGDCWWPEERGKAIAAYSLAPLLGPAVGPILGGFIAQHTDWRWVFWVSSMMDAVIIALGVIFLNETFSVALLRKKAKRMRKETGNEMLHTEYEVQGESLRIRLAKAAVRPFRLILTQPIIQLLSIYILFIYGLTFLIYATYTTLWTERYGQSMGESGLHYIALSIGFAVGTQIVAPLQDRLYARLKKRYKTAEGRPEFRMPLMVVGISGTVIGLLVYGWTAEYRVHWAVPDLGMVFFSVGVVVCFQCINTYTIDSYQTYAASALASLMFLRSIAGFGFPLFAPLMFRDLGYGWSGTMLAFITIALGVPAPILLWRYGVMLRAKSPYAAG